MNKILSYNGFLNESRFRWTKDLCQVEASKYKNKRDFKKNNIKAYRSAIHNGWLEEICSHMVPLLMGKNYWTKERCREEALKYTSKTEFELGSPTAYVKSGKMGWKDEICSHMKSNGNKYNRCIYAIEFPDNHVYIGLTYNLEKRFNQHLNDIENNSTVYRYFIKTGLTPIIKQLTDYLSVDDSVKMEQVKVDDYRNNGWIVLNTDKCGNVGGKTIKWTKEKCAQEALKYPNRGSFKNKSSFAYNAARRNKWLDDICSHMIKLHDSWDIESCRKVASKYSKRDHFKKGNSGAYGASYKNKWLDEFFRKNENMEFLEVNIPTYTDCLEICNKNSCFYESKHVIDGYKISLFNYRLANYRDFVDPIGDNSLSAKELRGLCFVFNDDGSLYNRYILLEKFFNLNQTPDSMYSVVKDYKISKVNNKEDGSIASFIKLPNGRVIGKSKMSFNSEQSNAINYIYDTNENIRNFVNWTLDNDYVAIFEYCSPNNRIVLNYKKTELILLRLRDNKTGNHLNIEDYLGNIGDIKIAPFEDEKSLDVLIDKSKTETGREGWIVTFDNDKMIKIKTQEYVSLHGLYTQDLNRENTLISLIIDEKIDDIIAQLGEDSNKREEVDVLVDVINKYIQDYTVEVDKLLSDWDATTGTEFYKKKHFALKWSKNKYFPVAIGVINGKDKLSLIKDKIKNDTKNLMAARKWLSDRGWVKPESIKNIEDEDVDS